MSTIPTVTITGYASGGEGVARLPDGHVVFVSGAARDDVCEVEITKQSSRSSRAEITRLLTPSPHRIQPDCSLYPACGGCHFRHITYEEELFAKLQRVNDALGRIGGASMRAEEILTTNQTQGYRNKAVFHATPDGKPGFYRSQSHDAIAVGHCLLLKDEINAALRDVPPLSQWSALRIRAGRNGLYGPMEEELDGLVFGMSPASFFQVNPGAALLLYQKAREYAALQPNETLADLYCGVGSLTLFLGRDAGSALGVEIEPASVEDAWANANRNGITNTQFICADAAQWDTGELRPDCVVVDPPRKGLLPGAVRKILELAPSRIVYVSCDPATMARDIRLLTGYTLRRVCAVDMFPRTANVECAALLTLL